MADSYEVNPKPRADVIHDLRGLARRGTTVRELDTLIRTRLGYAPSNVIGVIWYFKHAFCLPLVTVLPLQGWCGSDRDGEIDALLLPAIMSTRDQWENADDLGNGAADPEKKSGLTAVNQRS